MKHSFKRIISVLATFAIVVSLSPILASAEEYESRVASWWDSLIFKFVATDYDFPFVNVISIRIADSLSGAACAGASPDKLHHGFITAEGERGGIDKAGQPYVWVKCKYCGDMFKGYASDLSAAYDDYVQTLPAQGYTSAGGLSWKIVPYVGYVLGESRASGERLTDYVRAFGQAKGGASTCVYFILLEDFIAPIDGTYSLSAVTLDSYLATGSAVSSSAHNFNKLLLAGETVARAGTVGSSVNQILSVGFDSKTERGYWYGYVVISCVPHAPLGADTYNINTRPTSITGGNYGIIGDNGQITKVEDNSTIINETNNTYYNPATGQTVPISNWSYDYSDRSYKVTLESGDTATITYGDENITIQEGDTVYNVYYLVDGSGNPPCEHDWQEGEATVPTCVRPGSASYVCSLCGQTKTESIPALGHNWQVKQTVTTQYDDTGQLVQAGYTIFECSTCHEQYKSTDGTAPPGSGSGTDPGGEEEGGGFLSWLFGKIGELLGTIGDGILNLLKTALDKIFGGLIDLVNSLFENLAKLVDLFGSVGEAFQVLWTWLPPEITAILVAGVSIFVFVALLKFFMK